VSKKTDLRKQQCNEDQHTELKQTTTKTTDNGKNLSITTTKEQANHNA